MRPAGGYTPDMINFSQSVDVFKIWADMVAFDECRTEFNGPHTYCVYAGRRDGVNYVISQEDLKSWCGDRAKMFDYMNNAMSTTMGNEVCIACFDTFEQVKEYVNLAFAERS